MGAMVCWSGRFSVMCETLMDGSKVFNVEFQADTGELVHIACVDQQHAEDIAAPLASGFCDIAIYARGQAA